MRNNVFNISAPQRYTCQVYRYHNTLSRLYVSVYKDARPAPAFYVLFSDVAYFAGPMSWVGADFGVESVEQCLGLMLQAGLIEEALLDDPAVYDYFAQSVSLYVV
ncbi:MAG: hypothetical protein D6737_17870, partial [Chloroflexi bacterium]